MGMGKNELSRDLDIFGGSDDEVSNDMGTEGSNGGVMPSDSDSGSDSGMDIFGSEDEDEDIAAAESTIDPNESEEGSDDSSSSEEAGELASATDSTTEAGELDPVDAEMEALFKQLESEASSTDPEQDVIDDIISELRMKSAEDATQISFLTRQNEGLQNRLLEYASKDTDQALNQPLISKIEADPKLRSIIHLIGNTDEVAKDKLARILGDMYSEITGIDVASLAEESQNTKMAAALGGNKSASGQIGVASKDDKPMSYDDSISNLW